MSTQVVDDTPVAAVATETQHSVSGSNKDMFNWKPHDEDDAMVSNLIGSAATTDKNNDVAIAAPTEGVQSQSKPQIENHDTVMTALKVTKPSEHTEEPQSSTNPYLESVHIKPTWHGASMIKEAQSVNVAKPARSNFNALSSFSWDDDDSTKAAPGTQTATGSASESPSRKENALEHFLR